MCFLDFYHFINITNFFKLGCHLGFLIFVVLNIGIKNSKGHANNKNFEGCNLRPKRIIVIKWNIWVY